MSASVDADVTLEPFSGSVAVNPVFMAGGLIIDAGLDDIVIQGNPANPIAVQASGVPGHPIGLDMGLDNIKVDLEPVTLNPLTINPLTITLTPLSIDLKLEPIKMDLGLDNMNLAMSLAITEMPNMKVHAPIKMDFGVGILGIPLMNFSVCGETGFTTEDLPPRICQPVTPHAEPAAAELRSNRPIPPQPPFRVVLE